MSGTISAAVRFEDHFGPVVPAVTTSPTPSPAVTHRATCSDGLADLAQQMRHCVLGAISATSVTAKVELWESYRRARAKALAMAAVVPGDDDGPRLRSV
jgi:hypothetical protein